MLVDQLNPYGVQPLFTAFHIKLHFIVLFDGVDQTGLVYENIFAGIIRLNKSESFLLVEKFYCSLLHVLLILCVGILLFVGHSLFRRFGSEISVLIYIGQHVLKRSALGVLLSLFFAQFFFLLFFPSLFFFLPFNKLI